VDTKARNQLAMATLVFAKVFGIAGLILGATSHRVVGGALLVFDGFLLAFAAYLGVRNMKEEKVEETDQKQVLQRMMREGTLDQYLRDLRAEEPPAAARPSAPAPAARQPEYASASLAIRTPAT
jgi:uncharacterized membrane protein YebE (DUF533 family)